MATIVRTEDKDYGGLMVWVEEDIFSPIYFADGVYDNAILDAVLKVRRDADKEAVVDSYFAEVADEAATGVEAQRQAEQAALGAVYKNMTRQDVRDSVSVTVNTAAVSP